MPLKQLTTALGLCLILTGCASETTMPTQYSGFLSDYSGLHPAESASGVSVMRWVAADFQPQAYHSILVEKPQFYPAPKPNKQVSQATLDEIANYLQSALERELSGQLRVVKQAEPDTIVLRSAISAVELTPEGLQVYEVVPIALVAAAAMSAAGERDLDSDIYIELEAVDGRTQLPLTRVVRKGHGLQLENDSTQLRLDDLKPVLDQWAKDARDFKPRAMATP